jgi:hypothetical protein
MTKLAITTTAALISTAAVLNLQPLLAAPASKVACWMNKVKQTCIMSPAPKDGFKMEFSAGDGPIFVFTPAGPPTTLNLKMKDAQGRTWLMTGNKSFTLQEVGGSHNVIEVSAP